ncbi:hypothetical protein VTG60DRAFT_5517 [Thermothelomyces hinnuleus]
MFDRSISATRSHPDTCSSCGPVGRCLSMPCSGNGSWSYTCGPLRAARAANARLKTRGGESKWVPPITVYARRYAVEKAWSPRPGHRDQEQERRRRESGPRKIMTNRRPPTAWSEPGVERPNKKAFDGRGVYQDRDGITADLDSLMKRNAVVSFQSISPRSNTKYGPRSE